MSIFFKGLFEGLAQKSNPVSALDVTYVDPGRPVYTRTDAANLVRHGFEGNVYVFRGINMIAQACASVDWKIYTDRTRKAEIPYDHPMQQLLQIPNPDMGRSTFTEQLFSYWMATGNCYICAIGPTSRTAAPQELWLLRPDRVKVIPSPDGVDSYVYEVAGRKKFFPAEMILHLKMFAPIDDYYGLSPVKVAAAVVDQMNEGNDWNTALLQNAARPSGALISQAWLPPNQYDRLHKLINEKYSGRRNAGKPILLEGGLDWKKFGMSPEEMDWLGGKREAAKEIAVALGVPPEMLGDSANKTYANYEEARQSFYTETVLPLLDKFRDQINSWLSPMFGPNIYMDYDRRDIDALQEDHNSVSIRILEQWNSSIITLNEARIANGYGGFESAGEIIKMPDGTFMPIKQLESHIGLQIQAAEAGLSGVTASTGKPPHVTEPKPSAAMPSDTKPPKVPSKTTVRIIEDEIEASVRP